jgi:hypothetical protein
MTGSRKRIGLLAAVLTLGLVLFTSNVAWAQPDDTSTDDTSTDDTSTDDTSTDDTTADSIADDADDGTEIVEVTEKDDSDWIVIWGGIALVVIIAIGLVWYFFLRDREESGGEA